MAPRRARWSPFAAATSLTAMIRANGSPSATGLSAGGVSRRVLEVRPHRTPELLHAAAFDGRSPAELFGGTLDPSAASEAVAILNSLPEPAMGWTIPGRDDRRDPRPGQICKAYPSPSPHWPTRVLIRNAGPQELLDPRPYITSKHPLPPRHRCRSRSLRIAGRSVSKTYETARRLPPRSPGHGSSPTVLALDEIAISPRAVLPTLMA
jgi:hypothetical protein